LHLGAVIGGDQVERGKSGARLFDDRLSGGQQHLERRRVFGLGLHVRSR
jgi:hypothetical protein